MNFATLLSDGWKSNLTDLSLIAGTITVIVTASSLLVGLIIKRPAQRWLRDAVFPIIAPIEKQVHELSGSISDAVIGNSKRWTSHDAHHAIFETRFNDRIITLNERMRVIEDRMQGGL